MKKAILLCILMFTWFIFASCDGLAYVDNPVEKETKTAKELAAKALIGTWKHVPKKHRHENYQSTDFFVIPANGKIKSNLYNKPEFNESTFSLDSDWFYYPNDSSLSGHLYTDIIPGGNKFLIKIKGTDMILQPDMGYSYPNDPTRYFEKVEDESGKTE